MDERKYAKYGNVTFKYIKFNLFTSLHANTQLLSRTWNACAALLHSQTAIETMA